MSIKCDDDFYLILGYLNNMDRKIYEFMIWQQDNLIYYNDFINRSPNYEVLR